MRKNIIFGSLPILLMVGAFVIVDPSAVFAANEGDFIMTVKSELGYPVAGTGFSIWCSTGNATTSVAGVTTAAGTVTLASTTLSLGLSPISCKSGDTFHITATTTGYISTTTYSGTYVTTAGGNAVPVWTKYSLKVTAMTSENNTDVMPQSGYLHFSSTTPPVGSITVASSTYLSSAWYLAASSTGDTGGTLLATSSGYINNTIANVVTSTSTQKDITFGGSGAVYNSTSPFLYGLKVVTANYPMAASVIPLSATYRGNATTSSDGANLYWADTSETAGILNIYAPGYLFASTTNTGFQSVTTASTSQVLITLGNHDATTTAITVSGTARGLETMLKLKDTSSFLNELNGSILPISGSPFSVSGALDLLYQAYSASDGLWHIAASSTDATGGTLSVSVDGYVTKSVSLVLTSATTTQRTVDIGGTEGTYHIVGLPYALKVTATDSAGTALSKATVTAGNSYSVSCSESGVTGVYYCAIPVSNTGSSLLAAKTGYNTNSANYSYRPAATTAQSTASVILTADLTPSTSGSSSAGSGGGGGEGYYVAPVTAPLSVLPASGCPVGYTCTAYAVSTPSIPASSIPSSIMIASFNRRLIKGVSGDDVKNLQAALNSDADTRIATAGAGSPGNETNLFGSLTMKAVQKFQVKYNIAKEGDEGYGQVGPKTRAKLNELF